MFAKLFNYHAIYKERCDFITKHLTDFAMLYVVSLVLRQIQNKSELKIFKMMTT